MPATRVARGDSGNLQRRHARIHQRHNPAHRPHKALRFTRAPVHVLGPVNCQHFLGQFGGKNLRRRPASALHRCAHVFALRRVNFPQVRNGHAGLLRKRLGRGRRRAVLERHLPRRAGQLLFGIGLPGEHALGQHRQPPRRGIRGDLALGAHQPLAPEQIAQAPAQLFLRPGNHPRRNLFQPDLQ